jgi:RNA polymerase sigma-70 factor, ECF subfamily
MDAPPQISDEVLYARLRQDGDMAAFEVIYARYERRLFGFLRGYLGTRADVEEVFHDTFIQVLRSPEVRFERGSFAAWVFKIARNLALNRTRSLRRADAVNANGVPIAPPPRADERLDATEQARALAHAVAGLPPPLAELYHLRAGGMSYQEIAFTLEIPVGTVKSRTHEMVERLKTGVITWTDA